MLSRFSSFVGPLSQFFSGQTEVVQPINPLLYLDAGTVSSYNPFGGSIEFFGNSYINIISNDFAFNTGDFTVELYFYRNVTTLQGLITTYYTVFNTGITSFIDYDNVLNVLMSDNLGNTVYLTHSAVNDQEWYHLAMVRHGSTFSTYLNGVSVSDNSPGVAANLNRNQLTLGKTFTNIENQFFNGLITNVRITKNAVYTSDFVSSFDQLESNGNTKLLLPCIESLDFLNDRNTDLPPKVVAFSNVIYSNNTPVTKTGPIRPKKLLNLISSDFTFGSTSSMKDSDYFDRILYYDGSIYSTASDFGTLESYTLEVWVNSKSVTPDASIFTNAWSPPLDINMFLGYDGGGNVWTGFYKGGDGFYSPSYYPANLNRWYQFVTTVDDDNIKFYVNGETFSSLSLSGVKPSSSGLGYILGKKWADDEYPVPYTDANIAIVRVWEGALTYSTIHQSYLDNQDRFFYVFELDPSTWDASASNIYDLRNNISGTVSGVGQTNSYGGALMFNQTNYINFGNPQPLNQSGDISVFVWIRFADFTTSFNRLVDHYGGAPNDFVFSVKESIGDGTGPRYMNIYTQNNYGIPGNPYAGLFDTTEINLNRWYLLGFTLEDGGDLTYYIDGITSSVFQNMSRFTTNNDFKIGSSSPNDGISGYVGKVIMHNRILTPNEVTNYYESTKSDYIDIGGSLVIGQGSERYLAVGGSVDWAVGTGDFCVEWFQYQTSDGPPNFPRLFSVGTYPNESIGVSIESGFFLGWLNGGITFYGGFGLGTYLNQWVHLAYVRESGQLSIYQNGERQWSQAVYNDVNNSTDSLFIGFGTNNYWNGYITNFRFVKGDHVYSGITFSVPTTPLTSITGTKLLLSAVSPELYDKDSSGLNKSITNVNGVTWSVLTPFA